MGRAETHAGDETLPLLDVHDGEHGTLVSMRVPAIPGLVFDIWCYEDKLGRAKAHRREGTSLLLFHELGGAEVRTRFSPQPGNVEIVATVTGPDIEAVRCVSSLNPCCQFAKSPGFGNRGDYVEDFVARCFVFLEGGLTLLKDTARIPGTRPRENDKANAATPWIQEYYPVWRKHPGQVKGQRGFSTDRPVLPIIGTVSRDGKHLVAVAWPETARLGQVWHSCIHPRPVIGESLDRAKRQIRSRARVYFMENDGPALLARFRADFPDWQRPGSAR